MQIAVHPTHSNPAPQKRQLDWKVARKIRWASAVVMPATSDGSQQSLAMRINKVTNCYALAMMLNPPNNLDS